MPNAEIKINPSQVVSVFNPERNAQLARKPNADGLYVYNPPFKVLCREGEKLFVCEGKLFDEGQNPVLEPPPAWRDMIEGMPDKAFANYGGKPVFKRKANGNNQSNAGQ